MCPIYKGLDNNFGLEQDVVMTDYTSYPAEGDHVDYETGSATDGQDGEDNHGAEDSEPDKESNEEEEEDEDEDEDEDEEEDEDEDWVGARR